MKTTDSAYKNEFQSFAFDFLTDNGLASYFSENYIIVPGLCDVRLKAVAEPQHTEDIRLYVQCRI